MLQIPKGTTHVNFIMMKDKIYIRYYFVHVTSTPKYWNITHRRWDLSYTHARAKTKVGYVKMKHAEEAYMVINLAKSIDVLVDYKFNN